jgi:hypothetical protein
MKSRMRDRAALVLARRPAPTDQQCHSTHAAVASDRCTGRPSHVGVFWNSRFIVASAAAAIAVHHCPNAHGQH